jgi:hypothetical protein
MSTLTAQILVGKNPVIEEDFCPSHALFLFEDSVPKENNFLKWMLLPTGLVGPRQQSTHQRIIWGSTSHSAMEDALLMIGLYVERIPALMELASRFFDPSLSILNVNATLTRGQTRQLDRLVRESQHDSHIAVSIFANSPLHDYASLLKQYRISMEVCAWRYAKVAPGPKFQMDFTNDQPFWPPDRRN